MIKNIVFDMGNVLVAYDGRKVCKHYIKDKKDRKRVFTAIFQSPEWVYLDMGMIPEEQAVDQMCARLPKRLHEAARLCMRDWRVVSNCISAPMPPCVCRCAIRNCCRKLTASTASFSQQKKNC